MYTIQQHFAEQDLGGFKLEYIMQSSRLGTAEGTKYAQEHQEERAHLGLRYGYIYTGLELVEVIEARKGLSALATITLTPVKILQLTSYSSYLRRFPRYSSVCLLR